MDGTWTDTTVNSAENAPRIQNVPADGKYDQSVLPSKLEIAVSIPVNNCEYFQCKLMIILFVGWQSGHVRHARLWRRICTSVGILE